MNIYVGNLPYSVTDDELRAAFEMPNNSEAEVAINALNESPFSGRNIKVNQARPRGERSRGGGRPRY